MKNRSISPTLLSIKPIKAKPLLRRERISAHTGRRTFISILIENGTPVSQVMGMTGHTKESTLQIYVDKFSPKRRESISFLEF